MNAKLQALIISATKWHWAYHMLKRWGYIELQRNFIEHHCTEGRMVTGNVQYLSLLLGNPTMMGM